MISGPCGRMSIGNTRRPEVGVVDPAAGDLRRQRRRRPGVHDVGVADEAAGLAALGLVVARAGRPTTGPSAACPRPGTIGSSWSTDAVGGDAVPQRDRHAEEALAADQPVAVEPLDPVVVAVAHVVGEPVELLAAGEERVAAVLVAPAVADVPLAAGDDLQRAAAALVELDRVGDRAGLAVQVARLAQQLDHRRLRLLDRQPGERGVRLAAGVGGQPRRLGGDDAPVAADDAARRQVELAPPRDVGRVAERADHGDARALVGLGQRMGDDRDLDVEDRRAHRRADERGVALVVGVGDEGDAADDELGPRRVDHARRRRARGTPAGGRRRAARGPRSRPGRRPCGRRRPTPSAPRRCRPRRGRGCAGTPAGSCAG